MGEKIKNNALVITIGLIGAFLTWALDIIPRANQFYKENIQDDLVCLTDHKITEDDISRLKNIEARAEYKIDWKNLRNDTILKERILNENNRIIDYIKSSGENIGKRKYAGVLYILAPAGWGKSYIINFIKSPPKSNLIKISLSDFTKDNYSFEYISDIRAYEFSTLPNLKSQAASKFNLDNLLAPYSTKSIIKDPTYILIDDFDEVHPNFSSKILSLINNFFINRKDNFHIIQFIIFSRPEGVKQYESSAHKGEKYYNIKKLELRTPSYATGGEIGGRIKAFIDYKNEDIDSSMLAKNLKNLLNNNPFLTATMKGLASANFIMEMATRDTNYTEIALKEELFSSYLKRARETHNRPMKEDELYMFVLKNIANMYANKVDNNGYFTVKDTDKLSIEYKGSRINFSVNEILDRSGICYLRPISFINPTYRFEPAWIHRYLIERK